MEAASPSQSLEPTIVVGQRVRWYPTAGQTQLAWRCFNQARMVYNQGLHQLEVAYRSEQKLTVNQLSLLWTQFKATDPRQFDVPSQVGQQALRHLDTAFKNFFRRVKAGGKPGYPKPKGRFSPDQCSLTLDSRSNAIQRAWSAGVLQMPGFGICKTRGLRSDGSLPVTVALSRDAVGQYWLSFNHDRKPPAITAPTEGWNSEVGVDLGLAHFAILSNGEKIDNPRHLNGRLKALRRNQKKLSRCTPGSKRYGRRKQHVAVLHSKVADARSDFLHQTSNRLLIRFGAIAVEDLNVQSMAKNKKLARHILDLGLSTFVAQLQYKAIWRGRSVEQCGRWDPTSQVCSACGHRGEKLSLSIRSWTCQACNTEHDRDVNAARNVLLYARRNRVKDVEGDTPVVSSRRPVKRQLPIDQPAQHTTWGVG